MVVKNSVKTFAPKAEENFANALIFGQYQGDEAGILLTSSSKGRVFLTYKPNANRYWQYQARLADAQPHWGTALATLHATQMTFITADQPTNSQEMHHISLIEALSDKL